MRILLTNDDGILAQGIISLAKELEKDHQVTLIAPDSQRSAQSHAITLFQTLLVKEVEIEGLRSKAYSVSGTPADCVRIGLESLIKEPVDIVFSGINMGLNAGMDIVYSGTVSAAVEASMYKIPSIAVSSEYLDHTVSYDDAVEYARKVLDLTKDKLKDSDIVLNINVPHKERGQIKGIKVCKVGGPILDYYVLEESQGGEKILKAAGRRDTKLEDNTDRHFLSEGYVTITPLRYDLTNHDLLGDVDSWLK